MKNKMSSSFDTLVSSPFYIVNKYSIDIFYSFSEYKKQTVVTEEELQFVTTSIKKLTDFGWTVLEWVKYNQDSNELFSFLLGYQLEEGRWYINVLSMYSDSKINGRNIELPESEKIVYLNEYFKEIDDDIQYKQIEKMPTEELIEHKQTILHKLENMLLEFERCEIKEEEKSEIEKLKQEVIESRVKVQKTLRMLQLVQQCNWGEISRKEAVREMKEYQNNVE